MNTKTRTLLLTGVLQIVRFLTKCPWTFKKLSSRWPTRRATVSRLPLLPVPPCRRSHEIWCACATLAPARYPGGGGVRALQSRDWRGPQRFGLFSAVPKVDLLRQGKGLRYLSTAASQGSLRHPTRRARAVAAPPPPETFASNLTTSCMYCRRGEGHGPRGLIADSDTPSDIMEIE